MLCLSISFVLKAQQDLKLINLRETSLNEALIEANKENKPVLLYFSNDQCGPCIKMEKEVFTDGSIVEFFSKNFICAKSKKIHRIEGDIIDSLNNELKIYDRRYDVIANPTFIVINAEGDLIHRTAGFKNTAAFLEFGEKALSTDRNYIQYEKKIGEGDYSFETVKGYLECVHSARIIYEEFGFSGEAQEILDRYFKNQNNLDYTSENNWYLINHFVYHPKSNAFDFVLKNQDLFISKYGEKEVNKKILEVFGINMFFGDQSSAGYQKLKEELAQWQYPQIAALTKYFSMQDDEDLNHFAREMDNVFCEYYYYFDFVINDKAWAIYEASKMENTNIDLGTLEIASKWMALITKLYSDNEYYVDTDTKLKERITELVE